MGRRAIGTWLSIMRVDGAFKMTGVSDRVIEPLRTTVLEKGYDVGSGVLAAVSPDVSIELDEFGQYVSVLASGTSPVTEQELGLICAQADNKLTDEDGIAKAHFADVPGIQYADILGFHLGLFAGHVVEGDFRSNGSSGGFATWILSEMMAAGLIDGVIHLSAVGGRNGLLFEYDISRDPSEIQKRAKSRYYPAELSSVLQRVRLEPGSYAVVGIPSIIMEVRLLAASDPIFGQRIKFTVGLICGHQKTTKYAESLAWQCGIKPGDLRSFDFRKKRAGGMAWDYEMEMTGLIDGVEVTLTRSQETLFGSDWGLGLFKAKFSDFTDDALNETADISLGDAWLDEYEADSAGNNVLIVRHPEILRIVEAGIKDSRVKLDRIDPSMVLRSQRGLVHHTRDELPYRLRKRDAARQWRPLKRVSAESKIPFLRRLVQDTREVMSGKSHIYYRDAVAAGEWAHFERRMGKHVRRYRRLYQLIRLQKLLKSEGVVAVARRVIRRVFVRGAK